MPASSDITDSRRVPRAHSPSRKQKPPITSLPETRVGNNVYEVTVKVTDSKGNSDEQDVTVKVTNVEEAGDGHPLDAAAEGWLPGDGHPD